MCSLLVATLCTTRKSVRAERAHWTTWQLSMSTRASKREPELMLLYRHVQGLSYSLSSGKASLLRLRKLSPTASHSSASRVQHIVTAVSSESPMTVGGRAGEKDDLSHTEVAQGMLDFINASATQYHAVEEASRLLSKAGFQRLSETAEWKLKTGGRYYFTRNLSTLVAFAVGSSFKAGNGFHLIGAHTDSPCLKLKPVSKGKKSGYLMANVEPYGGGLWHTWFDRDLTVAGRVIVRQGDKMLHRLVKVPRPILRIPMLAIHLYREISESGFKPNKQDHLTPVLATAVKTEINKTEAKKDSNGTKPGCESGEDDSPHHPLLLQLIAEELGIKADAIVDFELNVCDTQPGVIGGANHEFVWVGRLDNLAMSYCATAALAAAFPDEASLAGHDAVKAVALFDHEEVGSSSAQGAGGPVMRDAITRVTAAFDQGTEGAVERALQASLLVSADMAHAHHPNYPEKHDPDHKPQFHKGLVIKHNVNQRYATNAISATLFREVGKRRGIPAQEFSVRSDMACGSTIGPILASGLGCKTVDVGAPQLSMHSIREMCGVDDIGYSYRHFLAFFEDFSEVHIFEEVAPPEILGELTDTPCNHLGASAPT